jgi:hypothetical protein
VLSHQERAVRDAARGKVRRAIVAGELTPPTLCAQCGKPSKPDAAGRRTIHAHHHAGYEKPLDVEWLCVKCHFQHDKRPSGEQQGRAKLSWAIVAEIRAAYQPRGHRWRPETTARGLARKYGVSPRTVKRVVSGAGWIDAALSE